jgi:hypothetical protein
MQQEQTCQKKRETQRDSLLRSCAVMRLPNTAKENQSASACVNRSSAQCIGIVFAKIGTLVASCDALVIEEHPRGKDEIGNLITHD